MKFKHHEIMVAMKLNKNIKTKSIKFQCESSTDEARRRREKSEWIKKYFMLILGLTISLCKVGKY